MELSPPLVPRDGHTLKVILPGRVSSPGPGKQNKEQSLGDQQDIQLRWLERHTDLPVSITVVAGSGSGELLDREEYLQLLELVESDKHDLVLTEDLGRIVRRVNSYKFCELCEDHNVRLIAINNHNVDTARPGWRDAAFFVSYFYEKDNADKSARLKERLRSRFLAGGALERRIFGYIDPPGGAKNENERQKDPEAEEIYIEWFRRLEAGATFWQIADWLNEKGVPTGPYHRRTEWNADMVRQTTLNPILKGVRQHNRRKTRRNNATGRYKSERAPAEDLLERRCPHLTFFEEDYYDDVIARVKEANAIFKPGKDGRDPRLGRPKKRTVWPGQHVYCGVCGRAFRYGGHGQKTHMMCSGAYDYNCWNGITLDGPLAAEKMAAAILEEIRHLPDFEDAFAASLEHEVNNLHERHSGRVSEIDRELTRIERQLEHLATAIAENGTSETLNVKLRSLESQKRSLSRERRELLSLPETKIQMPSAAEIRKMSLDAFADLAVSSDEFSILIRQLISRIVVYPVHLIDGGHPRLRGQFVLDLTPLIPNTRFLPVLQPVLRRRLVVDLFDPPKRVRFREAVMSEKQKNTQGENCPRLRERDIAAKLGIAQSEVQHAAALNRKMQELGVTDPYQILQAPPAEVTRLHRHRHRRYHFEPLPFVRLY